MHHDFGCLQPSPLGRQEFKFVGFPLRRVMGDRMQNNTWVRGEGGKKLVLKLFANSVNEPCKTTRKERAKKINPTWVRCVVRRSSSLYHH
jgi:hypothetical protein